eukprot:3154020-Prymnesium_polylepis.1
MARGISSAEPMGGGPEEAEALARFSSNGKGAASSPAGIVPRDSAIVLCHRRQIEQSNSAMTAAAKIPRLRSSASPVWPQGKHSESSCE